MGARPDHGLSALEARRRLDEHGPNQLRVHQAPSALRLLIRQLRSPLIVLLLVAAVLASSVGDPKDVAVILAVVVVNGAIGAFQEHRAERALASLRALTPLGARVRRDGSVTEMLAADLVPGDVVLLCDGDIVPADGRLWDTVALRVDESTLTGESLPVDKLADAELPAETPLPDRVNMVFAGTGVTAGRGEMLVTDTGERTEVGQLARLASESRPQATPLERHVSWLGKLLSILAVLASMAVFGLGLVRGWPLQDVALVAVSLAVAAVPEGLPAAVTVVLALGVQRMAKRNAIVRRLAAVEALGSATAICTDKTGTLTRGEMEAVAIVADDRTLEVQDIAQPQACEGRPHLSELVLAAVLCNDARLDPEPSGDPTERALLDLARRLGLDERDLRTTWRRLTEIPFSPDRRWMATINECDGLVKAFVKGAPDVVFERCSQMSDQGEVVWLDEERRDRMGAAISNLTVGGLRVLAFASRRLSSVPPSEPSPDLVDDELVFLGLVGLLDTPRPEAPEAIRACHAAGIRVIMITGDHPETAAAVGQRLGLESDQVVTGRTLAHAGEAELDSLLAKSAIFARVAPQQKVEIVRALQSAGSVVAMTGDGANDAPALRLADIGVAMGVRGTAVAKEAADIVLADDNFATIAAAVEEGRTIYGNLRKSVLYLISGNFGEILVIFVAMLAGLPLPLQPIHILWINLVTDALPALALGMEPRDEEAMSRPPRPTAEHFLPRWSIPLILVPGALLAAVTLIAFTSSFGMETGQLLNGQTAAFTALILGHLGIGYANRASHSSSLRLSITSNPLLLTAIGLGVISLLVLLYWEPLRSVFHTSPLDAGTWVHILLLAPVPFMGAELVKWLSRSNQT